MIRIFIFLLAGSIATGQPFQLIVDRLNGDPDVAHAHEITVAIASSPKLNRQLDVLATIGTLKKIELSPATGRFAASHQSGVIRFTPKFVDAQMPTSADLRQKTCNMVFVLGYEAFKIAAEPTEEAAKEKLKTQIKALLASTPAGSSPDMTALILEYQNLAIANEARAYLQGWNDVLDAMEQTQQRKLTAEEIFRTLRNGRNTGPLLAAALLPQNQRIQPDGDFHFPENDHNLEAVMIALRSSAVPDFI